VPVLLGGIYTCHSQVSTYFSAPFIRLHLELRNTQGGRLELIVKRSLETSSILKQVSIRRNHLTGTRETILVNANVFFHVLCLSAGTDSTNQKLNIRMWEV
jgi:hypothetical protein